MQHGGNAPLSLLVLVAAEDWGCPPWDIAGGDPKVWLRRWIYWKNQVGKKRQKDVEDLRGKRG